MNFAFRLGCTWAAWFLVVGCGASQDDSISSGADQNLTEGKVVTQVTYLTGDASPYQTEADASLAAACDAFTAKVRTIAGTRLLDAKCGASTNVAKSAGIIMGAQMTTRWVIQVEQGTTAAPSRTTLLLGTASAYESEAVASFRSACSAELDRARTLFGDRLLGGGCDAPANTSSTSGAYVMGAAFNAFVLPAKGTSASIGASVVGSASTYESEALAGWKSSCELWGKGVSTTAGARLVTADCGTPANVAGPGTYLFASTGTIAAVSDIAAAPASSGGLLTMGDASPYQNEAFASWQTTCTAHLGVAKEIFGDRLVVGGCAQPTNVANAGVYQMAGSSPILVTSSGATKVVLAGYAFGDASTYANEAESSAAKGATTALRAAIARIGIDRVEGFEVGAPTNVAPAGSFLFGAPTKISIGLDLPANAAAPLSDSSSVKGAAMAYQTEAAAAWSQACDAAADKAKADYGARYLAAACGAPTYADNAFSSDFTTVILP